MSRAARDRAEAIAAYREINSALTDLQITCDLAIEKYIEAVSILHKVTGEKYDEPYWRARFSEELEDEIIGKERKSLEDSLEDCGYSPPSDYDMHNTLNRTQQGT